MTEYLGRRAAAQKPRLKYTVEITRLNASRFRAAIRSEQSQLSGERVLEGADCAEVAEAAALVVSMMLDPLATSTSIHETSGLGRAPAASLRWSLGLGIGADLGSLPEPSLGLALGLGLRSGGLYVSANASAWLAQSVVRDAIGAGHIDLFSGVLRGCLAVLRGEATELELAPCIALELGVSTGRGGGPTVVDPVTRAGFWMTSLVGLSLRQVSVRGLQASFTIDAGIPVFRPSFSIREAGDLFHASSVVGRAMVGVAWAFF